MESIRHQMEITAPIDTVFKAVATPEGVASWWSRDVRGTGGQGGKLEIWFGGHGPKALDRVGRVGDGWLTAGIDPATAARGREAIEAVAAANGRAVDPEHFGISLPVARHGVSDEARAQLAALYPGREPEELLPVGFDGVRDHLARHVEAGLSKFVLRLSDPTDEADDLRWLADVALPLQR